MTTKLWEKYRRPTLTCPFCGLDILTSTLACPNCKTQVCSFEVGPTNWTKAEANRRSVNGRFKG